jgi:TetR/AcrR family transcriptional repressor of nem operon
VQQATRDFFADQQSWVAGVLQDTGMPAAAARRAARAYLAALEGALLLARADRAGNGGPPAAAPVLDVATTVLDALGLSAA